MDVLQAAARGPRAAVRRSTSTRCSPTGRCPMQIAEQIDAGPHDDRRAGLPGTCPTRPRPATAAEHVKTSVAVEAIDPEPRAAALLPRGRLLRARGRGLPGRVSARARRSEDVLPPYTELVRFDAGERLHGEALRESARRLLRRHLARRPSSNPFVRFGEQLDRELPRLLEGEASDYHAYAFATVRMAGSAFELAAAHGRVAARAGGRRRLRGDAEIVEGCKSLSFRLARRRAFDPEQTVSALASAWEQAMERLDHALA